MKRVLRTMAITAAAGAVGLSGQAFATCAEEGPYFFQSCSGLGAGQPTWFAPEPGGALPPTIPAGPNQVDVVWWQLGFGNELLSDPSGGYSGGDGGGMHFGASPVDDRFMGNDEGFGNPTIAGGSDFVDAQPFGAPAGATCFAAAANWAFAGADGCCDNNRNYYGPGGVGDVGDNFLNPYYSAPPSAYAYTRMMDSPMGFLVREPTNTRFAAVFLRNAPRGGVPTPPDFTEGSWNFNLIVNGEPNPTQGGTPNIVPWQDIPQPSVSTAFADPNDKDNSPRIVTLNWTSIRLVHDGSVQPATEQTPGNALGHDRFGSPVTGQGVLDQPELASYVVQEKPGDGAGGCDAVAPWVPSSPVVPHAGDLAPHGTSVTVDPDTCVRLCTHLGRVPALAFTPPATKTERNAKQIESQRGLYGDIGYDLCSAAEIIGGALVSQRANLTAIERSQSGVKITFNTTVELDITAIDVVGFDQKGGRRVLMTVDPQQGTTGVGATYSIQVPSNIFRDTKKVQIILQPTGEGSNLLDVR